MGTLTTFHRGRAMATLCCGDELCVRIANETGGAALEMPTADETVPAEGGGGKGVNYIELRVTLDGEDGPSATKLDEDRNAWQHAQLFRTSNESAAEDAKRLVMKIYFAEVDDKPTTTTD